MPQVTNKIIKKEDYYFGRNEMSSDRQNKKSHFWRWHFEP